MLSAYTGQRRRISLPQYPKVTQAWQLLKPLYSPLKASQRPLRANHYRNQTFAIGLHLVSFWEIRQNGRPGGKGVMVCQRSGKILTVKSKYIGHYVLTYIMLHIDTINDIK